MASRKMSSQKIRVPTKTLADMVQQTINQKTEQHKKDMKTWEKKYEEWFRRVVITLEEVAGKASLDGVLPQYDHGYYGTVLRIDVPTRPVKPELNIVRAQRDLKMLTATVDEYITVVSGGDWECYL